MKKTKIIATLGPASSNPETLVQLYNNGVNIIRFNFSHADYEQASKNIALIKKLNADGLTNLSLLLDTKGPEIRTGVLLEPIHLKQGDIFRIYVDNKKMTGEKSIFCDYPYLIEDMEIGQEIILDSGLLSTEILSKTNDYVEVLAKNSIIFGSRRHVNLPGIRLKLPGITEQDRKDILFALENDFSFIAASFIRNKVGIDEIKELFASKNNTSIKLISKVENQEAIDNLDDIITYSDGIMVARGDLGIEVPIEKLSVYQKEMVEKSKELGKTIIIATHLLETMIENPFPTRAETSDIFHSVLQQPDCLMLSGETAIGKHPVEAVKMMTKVIEEAEKHVDYTPINYKNDTLSLRDIEKKLLIGSGIYLGNKMEIQALVILTKTGLLARLASAFRSKIKIFAFTKSESSLLVMNAFYGVQPIVLPNWNPQDYSKTMDEAINYLVNNNLIDKNGKIIAINDIQKGGKEIPILEIIRIEDFLSSL